MENTLTLNKEDIQEAIKTWLVTKGYTVKGIIQINVGLEYADRQEMSSGPVFKNITVNVTKDN